MKINKYYYHIDVILKSMVTTILLGAIKIEHSEAYS